MRSPTTAAPPLRTAARATYLSSPTGPKRLPFAFFVDVGFEAGQKQPAPLPLPPPHDVRIAITCCSTWASGR